MGVSMLPKLLAMVCNTIILIIYFSSPAIISTSTVNGTKVTRATSLVMNILNPKHSITSIIAKLCTVQVFFSNQLPIMENTPRFRSPAVMSIKLNKMVKV